MDRSLASTNQMSVSVVIPAYNSGKFLPAAIESVLAQTYRAAEIEIVVVDDGSTDDTKIVCDRYPTVKYIYQSNQGLPSARNKGIEASQGAYLIFLDSDDCLLPEAIEMGMNCLKDRPEAGFVFGRYIFRAINPDGSYSTQQLFDEPPPIASYATILAAEHNIQCATAICRREAVESIGGFALEQEDLNFFLQIARKFPIYFHDRVVSEYRYHGGNESSKSAKMLVQTLDTHSLEWDYIRQHDASRELRAAYKSGRARWIKFYGDRLIYDAIRLAQAGSSAALAQIQLVWNYDPQLRWIDREAYEVATTLLTATEQQQLIGNRQHSQQSYPQTQCLHQLFEAQVERTPDAIALVFKNQQLTYRELNERANQLAHHLQALNVQPETLVGISVERSLDTAIGILGILKAGGAYVPLDPAYPQERLAYMLADSQVPILVTVGAVASSFAAYSGTVVCLDRDLPQISQHSQTNPVCTVTPDNLIYIIYTSGSTGKPKGVQLTHANVGRLFAATQEWYQFDEDDVWTMFHSYAFDFSVWELWGALIYGGRVVIVPFEVSRSPQEFYELLAREQVTVLNQTPSAFRQLMGVAIDPQNQLALSLRWVIFGGEALDLHSLKPWFDKYGDTVPQLVNMYGITETTVHVTYRPIDSRDLDCRRQGKAQRGSVIGCPIPDLELYILDPDLQPVSIGEAGEMYVGGAGVARGYLNRPELTAERFIANPFQAESSSRLYKTGDLARYLPTGDIEYLGRIDNQVKIRGFRIELGEIEAAIVQNLPVREATVIVREDEPGDLRLVAYLVPATSAALDIAKIRQSLKQQLPDYMVPAAFVSVAAMPLTANGKLDRQALPMPDATSLGVATSVVSADTEIEAGLTEIWREILRLERVGVEDNFFDLGGNSLLGLKVIASIQTRWQVKVSPVRLYQYFNIRSMAAYLTELLATTPVGAASRHENRSSIEVNSSDRVQSSDRSSEISTDGVAVIGMVGRFPGANSIEELWENLRAGRESITFFAEDEIDPSVDPELLKDPNYVRAKGVLAGAELFDANFFQMGAREAQMMDPQARIFVELAYEALETAGYTAVDNNKIGVYAGAADNTYYEKHLIGSTAIESFGEFQTHLVNDRDYLTTRASYKLNLQGPSINVSTACSTSLVAIIQAYQGLLSRQCDLALAGGISIMPPQNQGYLYQEGSIFTPDGHCRPFDANAQGTSFNNGAGIVVLKRLKDAIADGDRIYTVIKGVGINNDGADKVSFTAPSIKGQMGAILQAQQEAGVDPETIAYIEAHGTATALGDPIEVEALTQAFRTKTSATQFCGIGSIKSNLGHLTAAAGVAGFIKTVLALYHRQIPPSINFTTPNPLIDFDNSPFYVNDKLVDWQSADYPRRAGVSSFGGGGTNAHVILEEPPQVAQPTSSTRPYQLLLLSGKTDTAIDRLTANLGSYLQQHPDLNLADVAYTLQQGRKTFSQRRFIVCQDAAEAIENLATLPPHLTATRQSPTQAPAVAFMFSGQGTQYVQMGSSLYRDEPIFRAAIDRCAEILQPLLDLDIRQLIYPATDSQTDRLAECTELLSQTRYTQPALFTIEYALAQLWQSWGIQPTAAIGHSIGELVAACLAGVFSLADGLKLVAVRGRLMWDLPAGSMLSVRLPASELSDRLPPEVSIAAINGVNLCVISGSTPQIDRLQRELESESVVCKGLHTSHAFHSPMMESIVAPFAELVKDIRLSPPQIPFISAVTADWITDEQATDPNYWAEHLVKPVRFAEGVQKLWQHQPTCVLLEVGPRQSLTTLASQQVTDRTNQVAIASMGTTAVDNADWQSLLQAVGQLWLAGITINWQQFYEREHRQRVPLPTYPFERQKFWIDPLSQQHTSPPALDRPTPTETYPDPIPMPSAQSIITTPEPRSVRLMPSIAAIIKDTAGVEIGESDRRATFLELGLDSLALTQVALSLKKQFKVKVTFRQLLEDCSTLTALAQSIDLQLPPDAFPAPVASIPAPAIDLPISAPTAVVMPTPTPTPQATTAPTILTGDRSAIESLVQQQLQIMARQLELLGGNPPAVPTPQPMPIVSIAPAVNAPDTSAHTNGNGNGKGSISSAPITAPTPVVKGPAPGTKISKAIDTSLSPAQQTALAQIIDRYVARTGESKRQAQVHRRYLADPRTVSGFTPLLKEMVYPIVTDRAKGSKLWDVDGHEYVDLTNGFGLNFFGWSPDFVTDALKAQLDKGTEIGPQSPLAGKVAKTIAQMTRMERVAFCNTGSEAVMAAFRIARTVTGRDRVVMFINSYHGAFDEVLVRAGANLKSVPAAPGVMATAIENILMLDYGTPESLDIIRQYADEIAAVIVEPVQSRHPNLQPQAFLQELRQITAQSEIALIFDEVVNGFRVAPGGAQEYFGIRADIATYGKVVGGGLPIGILTGSAQYMDALDGGFWQYGDRSIPEVGVTFFAGTFVRHPLALAAVEAVLDKLQSGGSDLQLSVAKKVDRLVAQLLNHCQLVGAQINIESFSSWFYLTFPPTETYGGLLFYLLREKGIHIWEYRPCFLTLAHTDADIDRIIWAFKVSIAELQAAGFLSSSANAIAINKNLPPQPGAKLGKDRDGNPAWFITDPQQTDRYRQLDISVN
jgi:amino acid adenylation domain-containing protein